MHSAMEFNMKQVFKVEGMSCGHCEKAITEALQRADAKALVHIDRSANRVEVDSSRDRITLVNVIRDEGYAVVGEDG